jgi:hypothetical protein
LRSWKKRSTSIGVSVSKLYVTFILWSYSDTVGEGDSLLMYLDHTQTDTHTDTDTHYRTLRTSDKHVAQAAKHTTHKVM